MQELQNDFRGGYTHRAEITCWSCNGSGSVEGARCGICMGKGTYSAGCGGAVEMDNSYPNFAYCKAEGRFVPPQEVSG